MGTTKYTIKGLLAVLNAYNSWTISLKQIITHHRCRYDKANMSVQFSFSVERTQCPFSQKWVFHPVSTGEWLSFTVCVAEFEASGPISHSLLKVNLFSAYWTFGFKSQMITNSLESNPGPTLGKQVWMCFSTSVCNGSFKPPLQEISCLSKYDF